jgi:zinc D-Ala-D-Ala carboxypeptidase
MQGVRRRALAVVGMSVLAVAGLAGSTALVSSTVQGAAPASLPARSAAPTIAATPSPAPTASPTPGAPATYDLRPTADPLATASPRPLPDCSYQDIPTPLASPDDWASTLVDTVYELPDSYEPPDLVNASHAGFSTGFDVRELMIPDLTAMAAAAADAGAPLGIASGYRSYWTQFWTFSYWVYNEGSERAKLDSARPGHSEHQLGLAVDFMDQYGQAPWLYADFATESPAGAWLAAHAAQYGFVLSYPAGKQAVTCYVYEPWHYRYVGHQEARAILASGLTPREWLWQHQPVPGPAAATPTLRWTSP